MPSAPVEAFTKSARAPTPPTKNEPLADEHAPAPDREDRRAGSAQSGEGVQRVDIGSRGEGRCRAVRRRLRNLRVHRRFLMSRSERTRGFATQEPNAAFTIFTADAVMYLRFDYYFLVGSIFPDCESKRDACRACILLDATVEPQDAHASRRASAPTALVVFPTVFCTNGRFRSRRMFAPSALIKYGKPAKILYIATTIK
ncbi:hypothetical protein DFH11DRAFT_1547909 [Phellopilus nigrolimitatus]|nr:hypothetical protein DFH11DRAFT_1547909 [Phellopilus nigrolimitatus]